MSPEVRRSIEAAAACPKCSAAPGDPCRTPSNQTCEPHQARVFADLFKPKSPTAA